MHIKENIKEYHVLRSYRRIAGLGLQERTILLTNKEAEVSRHFYQRFGSVGAPL